MATTFYSEYVKMKMTHIKTSTGEMVSAEKPVKGTVVYRKNSGQVYEMAQQTFAHRFRPI